MIVPVFFSKVKLEYGIIEGKHVILSVYRNTLFHSFFILNRERGFGRSFTPRWENGQSSVEASNFHIHLLRKFKVTLDSHRTRTQINVFIFLW